MRTIEEQKARQWLLKSKVQYTYVKLKTKSSGIMSDFVCKRPLLSFLYALISTLLAMDRTSQSIIYMDKMTMTNQNKNQTFQNAMT